jgi:hypothetical protein
MWNLPDDEGSKHLRNVGKFLRDYTVQYPSRRPSSISNPAKNRTQYAK